ncbi:Mediator of RNA polymerase II transcription subunit 25 [Vigna angularis]|uniref:Mediator of RNA polymerase II transcription subunit 25 n=1 Tax=Phaseolus angularis TaxID=3914 RepID=A0A8T0JXR2_PHAAN|nr:Mediator of RNA polymerase II transcription subunit 25 [Vigna angularis]
MQIQEIITSGKLSKLEHFEADEKVMNSAGLNGGTSMGLLSMGQTLFAMHMLDRIPSSVHYLPTLLIYLKDQTLGFHYHWVIFKGLFVWDHRGLVLAKETFQGPKWCKVGVPMNQNAMSGLGPSKVSFGNSTMIPTPGMSQLAQSGMQPLVNSGAANMRYGHSRHQVVCNLLNPNVKVWQESLFGERQGLSVFISKLEGYRDSYASETLAANWLSVMEIVRHISEDHMNNKHVGKADFLVFLTTNPHGFLGQLQCVQLCNYHHRHCNYLFLTAFHLIG